MKILILKTKIIIANLCWRIFCHITNYNPNGFVCIHVDRFDKNPSLPCADPDQVYEYDT